MSLESSIKENSILLQRIIAHIQNPAPHIKFTATIFSDSEYKIINTIFQIICKTHISNRYILGLLHSKFVNWYCYRFIFAKAIRSMYFSNEVAKNMPIPKLDSIESKAIADKIIVLVNQILALKATDPATPTHDLESSIDSLVYQLYNLNDDEIRIIES